MTATATETRKKTTMNAEAPKRVVISHKDHAHENTSKARAECRALMAEGKTPKLKKPAAKKAAPRKSAPKADSE